jgi:membrane-associated phospholipid phosphatase
MRSYYKTCLPNTNGLLRTTRLALLRIVSPVAVAFIASEVISFTYVRTRPFVSLAKRSGIAVIILGIGCGIARIAAGVHYPTDVVAGGVLGLLSPWFYFRVLDHCFRKANAYLQIS